MTSRRDSKNVSRPPSGSKSRSSTSPRGRTTVAPKRATTAPKRLSKRPIPRSEPAPPSVDEELGRLLAHLATLEKQNAELRGGLTAEALATLKEGLDALREMLLVTAAKLDTFTLREFDAFDPRKKALLEIRAVLLKAAGAQRARVAPPLPPRAKARPVDMTELVVTVESLRPPPRPSLPQIFVISPLPRLPFPKR